MVVIPSVLWPLKTSLGEGPVWFADEEVLRFVDIKQGRLHLFSPSKAIKQTEDIGGQPSFIVPASKGGAIIGNNKGLYIVQDHHSSPDLLLKIDMPLHNRTNDATVDNQGRLWFGTMDDDEKQETGSLYCYNPREPNPLHSTQIRSIVTNGPAFNGDNSILYYVDSASQKIWRFNLISDPTLTQGELFVALKHNEGYPDGIVVDSEDCLWVALWDGWGVRRYSPQGDLLMHIAFPCSRVTKIAFGGEKLQTAFVTTARIGLSEAELEQQPLAGALFSFEVDVAGRYLPPVQF